MFSSHGARRPSDGARYDAQATEARDDARFARFQNVVTAIVLIVVVSLAAAVLRACA